MEIVMSQIIVTGRSLAPASRPQSRFNHLTSVVGAAVGLAFAAVPATAGHDLYVLLQAVNQVQVVATQNGLPWQIVGSPIPVGNIGIVAVTTPDASHVWVPNGGDATVTAISTVYKTTQTFSVLTAQDTNGACATGSGQPPCSFPGQLVFNSAGTVAYMVDTGDSLLKYIDTYTHSVFATVPLGAIPFQVRLSLDGNTAYAANLGDNTVTVIDIPGKTVKTTIALPTPNNPGNCAAVGSPLSGPSPTGVRVSPDGSAVYVTNAYDLSLLPANPPCQPSTVTVISTSNNRIVNPAIPSGGFVATSVNFLPSGPLALVANTGTDAVPDNRIGVINKFTQTLVQDITLTGSTNGSTILGPAEIDPAGQFVYVPTIGLAGTITGPSTGGEAIATLSASTPAVQLNTFALPPGSFPLSIAIVPHQ
jgi:YVTN family beta-propeller protein